MSREKIKIFGKLKDTLSMPDLIGIQLDSFENFLQRERKCRLCGKKVTEGDSGFLCDGSKSGRHEFKPRANQGLHAVLKEVFPITYSKLKADESGETHEEKVIIEYEDYIIEAPAKTEEECKEKALTYSVPIRLILKMEKYPSKEIMEQKVFLCEVPLMTSAGSFIFNGIERVVVSQIQRSPGLYYDYSSKDDLYTGVIIPTRGSWLQFEADKKNIISVRLDRKKKEPVTTFLRLLGYDTSEKILEIFYNVKEEKVSDDLIDLYLAEDIFIDKVNEETGEVEQDIIIKSPQILTKEEISILEKYNISKVKVIKLKREESRAILATLEKDKASNLKEAVKILFDVIRHGDLFNFETAFEEIKSMYFEAKRYDLGNVGRVKLNKKTGLTLPESKKVLDIQDIVATLKILIEVSLGILPVDDIDHLGNRRVRSIGELLQQQMRIGLVRLERSVVDKLQTEEQSTLTLQTLFQHARVVKNQIKEFFGSGQLSQFMDQTNPLAEITHKRRLSALGPGGLSRERAGYEVRDVHYTHYGRVCPIETPEGPNIGLIISLASYGVINEYGFICTPYRRVENGKVTDKVEYLSADVEDNFKIAQANAQLTDKGGFVLKEVPVRSQGEFPFVKPKEIDYIDVSPKQVVSVSAGLIPFLEHNDANRALMGSNMQRQSVNLFVNEPPIVQTGLEERVARDTRVMVLSKSDGVVKNVSAERIIIETTRVHDENIVDLETGELEAKKGDPVIEVYNLIKYRTTNQATCFNQKPLVKTGEKIKKGDVIADGPSTKDGKLALGKNILVAYMPWEGYNYEDAIILNKNLVAFDKFTSVHIESFEVEARETKLGPEEITSDIPSVGQDQLKFLDESGIVKIGVIVRSGDILVGKVTPKSTKEITPEYKLLHSIFGERAKRSKDSSLRMPHGFEGIVIDVKEFSREKGDHLDNGVIKKVKVFVASKRKLSEGDKMAGRHGNKGVVSRIVPQESMPHLEDGTPIDIVLNPLGVPSRMNIGQILECHLAWAAKILGFNVVTPIFDAPSEDEVREWLKKAGLPEEGKVVLYDGRTGEKFHQKVTVGFVYMMKLNHLVDDKLHARSTGPYSLVTQQPLGGKAQFGGQRLGEMEVWALEAYGAANCLQELLTVKSDDLQGRQRAYEAIVKGTEIPDSGVPESFKVLVSELKSLALDVKVYGSNEKEIDLKNS